jgi:hypothetical protein
MSWWYTLFGGMSIIEKGFEKSSGIGNKNKKNKIKKNNS